MKILPESYRKCLSPEDRKAIGQPTIEESKKIGEEKGETELQKLIYSELNRRGMFFHWSRMDKKTRSKKGTPDFALPIRGQYVALECKTESGKQSSEQWDAQCLINLQGGNYYVVRTFDQFLAILKAHGL